MTNQPQSGEIEKISGHLRKQIERSYRLIERLLADRPLLALGTVNTLEPKSAAARRTFTWTRKVRAKTVTASLSPAQAQAFRRAIQTHRRIEELLQHIRDTSQSALLRPAADATKRPGRRRSAGGAGSS